MSAQIPEWFVNQYKRNVALLLQQKESRFEGTVTTDSYTAKAGTPVDQVGAVNARKVTGRHQDTEYTDTPHDRRWVYPQDYDWADLIDKEDRLRTLNDPQSAYAQNGANSMKRAKDDEVIEAFFADSKTGEDGGTTTSFPAAQQVASGSTGFTVTKLRTGVKLLRAAEVDMDTDMLFCAVSAEQIDDMFNETQMISLDYRTDAVLVDGKVRPFMGVNFIHSERLATNGSSERRCPLWAKSGMHLGKWADVQVEMDRLPTKRYATQVYTAVTVGATRLEEKKTVEIPCAE